MKALENYSINKLELKNRIVMPPMCMYSSDENGMVNEFHKMHYTARALGGVGLIIIEATAVAPNGRISSNDLGIWNDEHIPGLKSLVDLANSYGAKIGIQLAHAGRKCASNDKYIFAPSPIKFSEDYKMPKEMTKEDINKTIQEFADGARRANEAGFNTIEIHGAHGYLIHEFLSPITNKRSDEYGGSLENRTRFLREVLDQVKKVWPKDKPILLRVSADDYADEGIDKNEMVNIIDSIKDSIDMVHVSTGGLILTKFDIFPGYQVSHSEAIKTKCNMPTIAVGLIEEYDHIEEILYNNRADLVALGRPLLRDPNFVLNMAYKNKIKMKYPLQYERAYRIRS